MIELDLKSCGLMSCITSEEGDPEWSDKKRAKMKARAQSYINNSVCKNIQTSIEKAQSAFEAIKIITEQHGENETHDSLDLYLKLKNLHYQRGFNQQRFVNDFDGLISDFRERNIQLDENFIRIMFLAKIDGIRDYGSPTATFYNSMCIQQKEHRTYSFVKQQFLNLDLPKGKFNCPVLVSSYNNNVDYIANVSKCDYLDSNRDRDHRRNDSYNHNKRRNDNQNDNRDRSNR